MPQTLRISPPSMQPRGLIRRSPLTICRPPAGGRVWTGPGGSLAWLTDAWAGKGYTLSLGVPIIPTDSSGVAQGTLAAGATGAYNSYFVTLAQTLVAAGEGNSYLRLGWEFDGNWYPSWDADTPAAEASSPPTSTRS